MFLFCSFHSDDAFCALLPEVKAPLWVPLVGGAVAFLRHSAISAKTSWGMEETHAKNWSVTCLQSSGLSHIASATRWLIFCTWLKAQTKPEPLSGLQRNAIKSTMLPRTNTDIKILLSESPKNVMILTAYEKLASVWLRNEFLSQLVTWKET